MFDLTPGAIIQVSMTNLQVLAIGVHMRNLQVSIATHLSLINQITSICYNYHLRAEPPTLISIAFIKFQCFYEKIRNNKRTYSVSLNQIPLSGALFCLNKATMQLHNDIKVVRDICMTLRYALTSHVYLSQLLSVIFLCNNA